MHFDSVIASLLCPIGRIGKFIFQSHDFIVLKGPRRFSGQTGQKAVRHGHGRRGNRRLMKLMQDIQICPAASMAELYRAF